MFSDAIFGLLDGSNSPIVINCDFSSRFIVWGEDLKTNLSPATLKEFEIPVFPETESVTVYCYIISWFIYFNIRSNSSIY